MNSLRSRMEHKSNRCSILKARNRASQLEAIESQAEHPEYDYEEVTWQLVDEHNARYLTQLWTTGVHTNDFDRWYKWCEYITYQLKQTRHLNYSGDAWLNAVSPDFEGVYLLLGNWAQNSFRCWDGEYHYSLGMGNQLAKEGEDMIARRDMWINAFGRAPKDIRVLRSISREELNAGIKSGAMKFFPKLWGRCSDLVDAAENSLEIDPYSLGLYFRSESIEVAWDACTMFGADITSVYRALDTEGIQGLHDLTQGLPKRRLSIEELQFLNRNSTRRNQACAVLNDWEYWSQFGDLKDSVASFLAKRSQAKYSGYEWPELAEVAETSGYSYLYSACLKTLKQGIKGYNTVPFASAVSGEYRMYRTSDNDPRNLFLGSLTQCCQHPEGAGETCAYHGQLDPSGAFFVVEKAGQVIAQSWAWTKTIGGKKFLVFDNVEALSGHRNNVKVLNLYKEVAQQLLGKLGIAQVNVGMGHNDIEMLSEFPLAQGSDDPGIPEYTDDIRIWVPAEPEHSTESGLVEESPMGALYTDARIQRILCKL